MMSTSTSATKPRSSSSNGRFAAPGFIEGHGHYMSLGNSKTILDLNGAANWAAIVEMVAEAAADAEPGQWIRGRGWHQEKWDRPPDPAVEGNPTHASLSAVSPDNPVLLGHASGHASFANAAALAAGGYDRDSEPPPGRRTRPRRERRTHRSPARNRRSAPSPPPSPAPSPTARRTRSTLNSGVEVAAGRRRGSLQGCHLVPRRGRVLFDH